MLHHDEEKSVDESTSPSPTPSWIQRIDAFRPRFFGPLYRGVPHLSGKFMFGKALDFCREDGTGPSAVTTAAHNQAIDSDSQSASFFLGPTEAYYTLDQATVKKIFYQENGEAKPRYGDTLQRVIVGPRMLTTLDPQSEEYQKQRKFYEQNLLTDHALSTYLSSLYANMEKHFSESKKEPIENIGQLQQFVHHAIADSIAEVALGIKDFKERDDVIALMNKAPNVLMNLTNWLISQAHYRLNLSVPGLMDYIGKALSGSLGIDFSPEFKTLINELKDYLAECHRLASTVLEKHKKTILEGESFFKSFCEEFKIEFNSELSRQLLMFLLFGGFETTSAATFFTILSAAARPDLHAELVEEINQHWKPGQKLDLHAISHMHKLDHFAREALRLFPPFSMAQMSLTENIMLNNGTFLRKGTLVIYSLYRMHRQKNKINGEDADQFKLRDEGTLNETARRRFNFLTFGRPPKTCVGRRLAMLEQKMALLILSRAGLQLNLDKRFMATFPNLPLLEKFSLTLQERDAEGNKISEYAFSMQQPGSVAELTPVTDAPSQIRRRR